MKNELREIKKWLMFIAIMLIVISMNTCSTSHQLLMAAHAADDWVPDETGEIIPESEIPYPLFIPYDLPEVMDMDDPITYILAVTVNLAAREHEIDVYWLWATLKQESGYRHWDDDFNIVRGAAGEWGIGQILDDGMEIKNKYDVTTLQGNIHCAAELLAFGLRERANGDMWRASGWYNTGDPVMNGYAYSIRDTYDTLSQNITAIVP